MRFVSPPRSAVAPHWGVLRGHPRFQELLVSLGLSDVSLPDEEPGR